MTKPQQNIVDYLKNPSAREAIVADLEELSNIVLSIEGSFAYVASQMSILDEKNILSHKFAPNWKLLHDEYTTLRGESRQAANNISDKIDTLMENVDLVLQEDTSLDVKKAILSEYIERLKQFQPEAQEHATGFLRLGQEVTAFKLNLKDKVEGEKKEAENKLKEIEERLVMLESDLKMLSHRAERGWRVMKGIWPFGDKGSKVESAAISALAEIAPTVVEKMIVCFNLK